MSFIHACIQQRMMNFRLLRTLLISKIIFKRKQFCFIFVKLSNSETLVTCGTSYIKMKDCVCSKVSKKSVCRLKLLMEYKVMITNCQWNCKATIKQTSIHAHNQILTKADDRLQGWRTDGNSVGRRWAGKVYLGEKHFLFQQVPNHTPSWLIILIQLIKSTLYYVSFLFFYSQIWFVCCTFFNQGQWQRCEIVCDLWANSTSILSWLT